MLREKISLRRTQEVTKIQQIRTKDEDGNIIEEKLDDTLNDDDNEQKNGSESLQVRVLFLYGPCIVNTSTNISYKLSNSVRGP